MSFSLFRTEPDLIRAWTDPAILAEIDRAAEDRVLYYATQPPGVISLRIAELERERSIEKWLDLNYGVIGLIGLVLGARRKSWLALSFAAFASAIQQATQGWSALLPALRRAGLRSQIEIEREKFALKVLRGDFASAKSVGSTDSNALFRGQESLRAVTA